MRALLDTNAFLWASVAPARLGSQWAVIDDLATERLLSTASAWEIAIKWATGKLTLDEHPSEHVRHGLDRLVIERVEIELAHVMAVADLPLHHRDPFDRLLIAQARALDVPIITADHAFQDYEVELLFIE